MDNRVIKLAENITSYSIDVKPKQKVLIDIVGMNCEPLVNELIEQISKLGGMPYVDIQSSKIQRELIMNCTEEQMDFFVETKKPLYENMDTFIVIRSQENSEEYSDIPPEKLMLYTNKLIELAKIRLSRNWTYLIYPNASFAQSAKMSQKGFEDFYFNVSTIDYKKMSFAMDSLVSLMEKTDKVKIVGKDTNLTFSIKDIKAVKCDGKLNIPDGEVFTAPVKESINGKVTFNVPSSYQGFTFNDICLEFKDGKIINATANDSERLNKILDIDTGARYTGEFALGLNPYITKPMNNILYDEKISGSFHLTPGRCYSNAPNGNQSSIHWDLVCIQTPEYGGGEIYFDNVLIRKDGLFVIDELEHLNPKCLI